MTTVTQLLIKALFTRTAGRRLYRFTRIASRRLHRLFVYMYCRQAVVQVVCLLALQAGGCTGCLFTHTAGRRLYGLFVRGEGEGRGWDSRISLTRYRCLTTRPSGQIGYRWNISYDVTSYLGYRRNVTCDVTFQDISETLLVTSRLRIRLKRDLWRHVSVRIQLKPCLWRHVSALLVTTKHYLWRHVSVKIQVKHYLWRHVSSRVRWSITCDATSLLW